MPSFLLDWGRRGITLAALALFFGVSPGFAQTGAIEGTVRDARRDQRIANARLAVQGTNLITTTNENGYYRIENVPVGTYTVRVQVIGYNSVQADNARVTAGLPLTVDFELLPAVINLDALVVTGVVGETQTAKLPFDVDQITSEQMQVPQIDAASAISGKVAGAQVVRASGRPGAAPTILLRGATSINAAGRDQEPLYVVDGVILGSSMVDIDALDIESIEVIKGAAASSLYGSRAASGVVQISTKRGRGVSAEEIRFSVRSEAGFNQLPGRFDLTQHHQFALTADGSQFVDNVTGDPCDWLTCTNQPALAGTDGWDTYVDGEWPGTTYDQVDRFFTGGNFFQQYLSAEGRAGSTNFHASYSNMQEGGILPGLDGFIRNNFRINVDQSLGSSFQVGASAFYSTSQQDDVGTGGFSTLTRLPAGVDLLQLNACPETGECATWQEPKLLPDGTQDPNDVFLIPDPFNTESVNPIYTLLNTEDIRNRARFLGSTNVRFRPFDWLSIDGNMSYDRLDNRNQYYRPKGFKSIDDGDLSNILGGLRRYHATTETFNASANVTFTKAFGDLDTRTQFRYLAEWDEYEDWEAGGDRFAVANVPVIDNLDPARVDASSTIQPVRADGYFGITSMVFKDRYIVDALVRNDGSSLFGADQRRQWYYRLAGAWRVSEDLILPGIDELKVRYAYGTAGGRPRFTAQYETYDVSGGSVSPITLGNVDLKPEFSAEQEAGIDAMLFGLAGLTVNYATTTTTNQILPVPLLSPTGYRTQWQNAGTLSSKTWEASLDLQFVQTRSVTWSGKFLFDRTRQKITHLNVAPFTYGVGGQGMEAVFFAREGEALGTFYGTKYATSCDDLLGAMPCSDFAVNSDGLLVWVGEGGSLDNPQWGTQGPSFGFYGQERTMMWGSAITGWNIDPISGDTTSYLPIGKTNPDYNLGISTTFRIGGLSLYALIESVQGIQVYNQPQQWAIFKGYAGVLDQTGDPEAERKPIGYYDQLYGVAGLRAVNFFLQDASFTKLREVSLRYRFDRNVLSGTPLRFFEGIAVSIIGRNLLSFDNYNGYDPETGRDGGDTGSAAIARVDGYEYPQFRTFTAAIELNF
ncbi:SusC/RagA family TonB-linked outer membrane protein [Gemmatimonadota bacterium]